MASLLNEHTQYVDDNGKPFVDGFVYIGEQGADPKLNPKTIYEDRELTTPIANPQAIGADGRSVNKIWLDGRYSILVEDLNNNQEYQNLDNGADESSGSTNLVNVIGANNITAEAAVTITQYVDKQVYIFTSAQTNTGPVTLDIDNVGVKDVTRDNGDAINAGDMGAGYVQVVIYNEVTDDFQWINTVEVPYVPPVPDFELLETIEVTTPVSSVEFTGLDAYTDHENFKIIYQNVLADTAGTELWMRVGIGATPTWESGGTDYGYHLNKSTFAAATYSGQADASDSKIIINQNLNISGSNICELIFSDMKSTTRGTAVKGSGSTNTTNAGQEASFSGAYYGTTEVTGIQFFGAAQSIATGKFKLYGIK